MKILGFFMILLGSFILGWTAENVSQLVMVITGMILLLVGASLFWGI